MSGSYFCQKCKSTDPGWYQDSIKGIKEHGTLPFVIASTATLSSGAFIFI